MAAPGAPVAGTSRDEVELSPQMYALPAHESASVTLEKLSFDNFMDDHGKVAVDFQKVWDDFGKLCFDVEPKNSAVGTYAMAFANKVIYEISVEARQIKPKGRDRSWNLIIPEDGDRTEATINVATYKNVDAAHSYTYRFGSRRIMLSMRLANMVAVEILCTHSLHFGHKIMTPLGGAVYSMKDVPAIAAKIGKTEIEVCCMINRSTVGTPYQLSSSDFACAISATLVTTKKMSNKDDARKIVNKITKGYIKDNKALDMIKVRVWMQYATGGIPEEYTMENLQRIADASRLN